MKVKLNLRIYFIGLGFILIIGSCSGRSGGGSGFVATSACPNFMPLDEDISDAYSGGVSVIANGQDVGCLTFVRSIQKGADFEYNYGIINQQGYLFNLNDKGQISSTGEPWGGMVSFVQVKNSGTKDTKGMVTRGHFGVCQIAYMPQDIADIKDERYPDAGGLKFFYAYKVKGDTDPTYGCLDISASKTTRTTNQDFSVLRNKASSDDIVEIWTGEVSSHRGTVGYYDGEILDQTTCLQDAFGQDSIPDYRGTISFVSQSNTPIPQEDILEFAKNSQEYCVDQNTEMAKKRCAETRKAERYDELTEEERKQL